MTPIQREQLRISILRYLASAGGNGMSAALLLAYVKAEGHQRATEEAVTNEAHYLVDKRLVATLDKEISPEVVRWRITAEGRDWLATQGIDTQ